MTRWVKNPEITPDIAAAMMAVEFEEVAPDPTRSAYRREYRAKHPEQREKDKQRWASSRASRRPLRAFAGVDGEGATVDGFHRYALLRAGEHVLIEEKQSLPAFRRNVRGLGLSWQQILDWLCHLPRDLEYVAFAFDYDATMILRSYPHWKAIKKLVTTGFAYFLDGDVGWQIWYRPRMEFKVNPIRRCEKNPAGWCSANLSRNKNDRCECNRPSDESRGGLFRVSDTIKLFQSTFLKVVDDWEAGTPDIRAIIQSGKDRREVVEFLDRTEREEVTEYNRMECILLADIMTQFRDAWLATGLPQPSNWQSPGSLAIAAFRKFKVPTRKEIDALGIVPEAVWEMATAAMYGGWFEVSLFGPVPGLYGPAFDLTSMGYRSEFTSLVTEYDLTSAYPYSATRLPCLRHSVWEHREPGPDEYALQAVHATYRRPVIADILPYEPDVHKDPAYPVFMGLPHRDDHHRVSRPLETVGVYWNFEVEQARHQDIKILDSWTWVKVCDCETFGFIPELFQLRKQLGSKKGKPVKLAINSMYGKLAQRIGDNPPYVNLIAASFITAWTRATIMRTIHESSCEQGLRCGSNVVMIATDAVFFAGDPELPYSKKGDAQLGDWTREEFPDGLFIVQGGVYWPPGATEAMSKTRGIPVSILHEHIRDFEDAYKRLITGRVKEDGSFEWNLNDGVVTVQYRRSPSGQRVGAKRFVGLREAVHRGAQSQLGRFVPFTRDLGFDWTSKRVPYPRNANAVPRPDMPLWTIPKSVDEVRSVSYAPVKPPWHGMAEYNNPDQILDSMNDSPDWMPQLFMEAGDVEFGSEDAMSMGV
jgi:hypothetical protein